MKHETKIFHHPISYYGDFPPAHEYEILYKRYLNEDRLQRFLDILPTYKNKTVLDLCCGSGRAGIETLNRQAKSVLFVDKSKQMFKYHKEHEFVEQNIHHFLNKNNNKFDVVLCQEAVNYWFDHESSELLSNSIAENGYFIFNTFECFDINELRVNNYEIESKHYVEFVYRTNENKMKHVQVCDNLTHIHTFKYIDREFFINQLEKYFKVDVKKVENTLLFCCQKI